jgi:isopentenyl diphosphate isomerase/L-lactate dehydrogenase-like FMN-dependent dehydrogenase
MNSSQRRVDARRWRYRVTTPAVDYNDYVEMWEWLKARHTTKINRCGWRDRILNDISNYKIDIRWEFLRERDAVEFALIWAK